VFLKDPAAVDHGYHLRQARKLVPCRDSKPGYQRCFNHYWLSAQRGGEKEPVLCQPITIGRYSLDGAAEAQVTGREVLAHLQELEFLMATLMRRIKTVNLGPSPRHDADQRASDERGVLAIIGDGLLTHLIGRSQNVREEAARLAGEKKS
jgi:hypothetical protein